MADMSNKQAQRKPADYFCLDFDQTFAKLKTEKGVKPRVYTLIGNLATIE